MTFFTFFTFLTYLFHFDFWLVFDSFWLVSTLFYLFWPKWLIFKSVKSFHSIKSPKIISRFWLEKAPKILLFLLRIWTKRVWNIDQKYSSFSHQESQRKQGPIRVMHREEILIQYSSYWPKPTKELGNKRSFLIRSWSCSKLSVDGVLVINFIFICFSKSSFFVSLHFK